MLVPPEDELSTSLYNSVIVDSIATKPPPSVQPPTPSSPSTSAWKLLRVTATAHDGWIRALTVDPFNTFVASGGADAVVKVWDMTATTIKASISGHILPVRSLVASSRHPYLFSGSEDKMVKCWDLERSHTPHSLVRDYYGHVGGVYCAALHPDLDLLFTGGRDQVVRVWDIRSRTQVMLLQGHTNDISLLATQSTDPQVISSLMDKTICLWDLRKQERALQITQHVKSIRSMALHPKELTFVSGDLAGNFKQWLLPKGQLLQQFSSTGEDSIANTVAINPVTNELFAGYDGGKLEWWNYETATLKGKEQTTAVNTNQECPVYCSAFDMLGSRLFTGEGDKSIKVWGND